MSFSNIRFIALMAVTTIGISTWVPEANGAPSDTSKSNLAGCINELDAWSPGMKEKVKTFTEDEFYRLSERMNDYTGVKDLDEADLAEMVEFDIEYYMENPSGGNAQARLDSCMRKMQYAKTHNGNTVPPNTKAAPASFTATTSTNTNGSLDQAQTDEKDFDSCQPALDAQELEFKAINARNPNTKTVVMGTAIPSAVPGLQVTLYMTEKRMKLLNDYCKGQPQYSQYESIKNSHDVTKEVCLKSTSDPSVCKPVLAW